MNANQSAFIRENLRLKPPSQVTRMKYVLETEKLTVEDLFTRDIDPDALEVKVLSTL